MKSAHLTTSKNIILVILVGLLVLTIGKDLLHSSIRDYQFYLSESMLFGTFWLLFVPFALLNMKVLNRRHTHRLAIPLMLSAMHLITFSLLVFAISSLFFSFTFGIKRVFTDALADNSIACLLIYGVLNVVLTRNNKFLDEEHPEASRIRVKHREQVVFVACDDIVYIKAERPYIALVTPDRTYLYNSSLKQFLHDHLNDSFVRIHRSTIVNADHIISSRSRHNGDYDVLMSNGETVRASRNYNALFALGS